MNSTSTPVLLERDAVPAVFDVLPALAADWQRLRERERVLTEALGDLHALVQGEVPSLLDGDRGGSSHIAFRVEAALTPEPK